MNRLRKCGVALLLFVCSALSTAYSQGQTLSMSLEECLEYAKQNSISLQQAKLDVENNVANELSAKGALYPTVAGSISQGLTATPLTTVGDKGTYSGSYGVDLSMTLYNGGKLKAQLSQSALASEISLLELKEQENSLEVSVTEIFVEILYAMEQIKVAESTIEINLKTEERGRAYLEVGSINKAEYAQLESATAESKYDLVVAQTQLSNLNVALKHLLEISQDVTIEVKDPNLSSESLAVVIPTVQDIYNDALASRPEIKASQLNLDYTQYNTTIAKAGYLPTLSLSAGTGVSHNSSSDYTFSGQLRNNFDTSVGLNLSVPIFSQFKNRSAVRIANNSVSSASLSLTQAQKDLYQTIETLHNNASTSQSKYLMSEYLLTAQERSLALATERYEVGAQSIIELLIEQNSYNQTRQTLLINKYQFILNQALLNYYKTNIIKL